MDGWVMDDIANFFVFHYRPTLTHTGVDWKKTKCGDDIGQSSLRQDLPCFRIHISGSISNWNASGGRTPTFLLHFDPLSATLHMTKSRLLKWPSFWVSYCISMPISTWSKNVRPNYRWLSTCYCSVMLLFCCFCFPVWVFIGRMLVQVYPAFVSCWHVFFFLTIVCLFVLHYASNKFDLMWFWFAFVNFRGEGGTNTD